jgi:hypothetical protein
MGNYGDENYGALNFLTWPRRTERNGEWRSQPIKCTVILVGLEVGLAVGVSGAFVRCPRGIGPSSPGLEEVMRGEELV